MNLSIPEWHVIKLTSFLPIPKTMTDKGRKIIRSRSANALLPQIHKHTDKVLFVTPIELTRHPRA